MDRDIAIERLQDLVGRDLIEVAREHDVTVRKNGKINKGWAGQTVERHLGLPINSSRSPNLGTWELKLVSLRWLKNGDLAIKETMAITMLDPVEVTSKEFEESHLYTKLRKIISVARIWESKEEQSSICHSVNAFELDGTNLFADVADDYESIRQTIRDEGFDKLTGRMGQFVQPRTKGTGHGSTSRAFYARKELVEYIIGRKTSPFIRSPRKSSDCSEHAGIQNTDNRAHMEVIMNGLPANQSGKGRHKCAYCAYEAGYSDALAEIGR